MANEEEKETAKNPNDGSAIKGGYNKPPEEVKPPSPNPPPAPPPSKPNESNKDDK
jgi:hypothetical protein